MQTALLAVILWYTCCGISLPKTESLLSPVVKNSAELWGCYAVQSEQTCWLYKIKSVIHLFIKCVFSFCPPPSYAEFHFLPGVVLARCPWGLAVISSQAYSCFHHIQEASEEGDNQLLHSTAISLNFLVRLTGLDTTGAFLSVYSKLTMTADRKSSCTTKVMK